MPNFKMSLDNAIKARDHAISEALLLKQAIDFVNSMLDAAISVHKSNESMAQYRVECAFSLIRYFVSPSMSAWDVNSKLNGYLLTIQLPE